VKTFLGLLFIASWIPVWRSGLVERMTLWEWALNHTVLGAPSEYIAEEYYLPDTPVEV